MNTVLNQEDLDRLTDFAEGFHDGCIKEMRYVSGAFVDPERWMHPTNDKRELRVVIQSQSEAVGAVELVFQRLRFLKLFPVDETCSCEIHDSKLVFRHGFVYWCDSADVRDEDLDTYEGTVVCAEALQWRRLDPRLGKEPFYSLPPAEDE